MKVISIANMKGGCGKTTSTALLCSGLKAQGKKVALIDCDQLSPLFDWARAIDLGAKASFRASNPNDLITQTKSLDANVDYLLVDLSGASEITNAVAFGLSDLVLVPMQGSAMDARAAGRTIRLIHQVAENRSERIAVCTVLTRVSPHLLEDAITFSSEINSTLGVPVLLAPILERTAFREMFRSMTDLMSPKCPSLGHLCNAQEDIRLLTQSVRLECRGLSGFETDDFTAIFSANSIFAQSFNT